VFLASFPAGLMIKIFIVDKYFIEKKKGKSENLSLNASPF